jgi:hypothetical protein
MNSLPDLAANARRAWLRETQDSQMPVQSDFENSLAFRLVLLVAVVVIGINVLAPAPEPAASLPTHHASV